MALLALSAAGAMLFAEWAYRSRFHHELAALNCSFEAAHPRSDRMDPWFTRFGESVQEPRPSLVVDLLQWARRRSGWESRLNSGARSDSWSHSYYSIGFSEKTWPGYRHVFIWSPRRWGFVHYWTEGACPHSCPWIHAPGP